ncbi:unnamed protein product [Allacma fusca]|uniref:Uncharacterized protein n=1 Tax=Allacma fusca TaxID=39272 RepID=A0A8J2K6F7_9HEXA|nr:unnamed protein product [Allacma fusca]
MRSFLNSIFKNSTAVNNSDSDSETESLAISLTRQRSWSTWIFVIESTLQCRLTSASFKILILYFQHKMAS